jgi:hypothetical protein
VLECISQVAPRSSKVRSVFSRSIVHARCSSMDCTALAE